jgi:hypothetical protein
VQRAPLGPRTARIASSIVAWRLASLAGPTRGPSASASRGVARGSERERSGGRSERTGDDGDETESATGPHTAFRSVRCWLALRLYSTNHNRAHLASLIVFPSFMFDMHVLLRNFPKAVCENVPSQMNLCSQQVTTSTLIGHMHYDVTLLGTHVTSAAQPNIFSPMRSRRTMRCWSRQETRLEICCPA